MRSMDMAREINKTAKNPRGAGRKSLGKEQIATRISSATMKKLRDYCEQHPSAIQAHIIEEAIENWINDELNK